MKKLPLSIGILSWKGYKSLNNSLESYERYGLNKITSSKFICLPEYSDEGVKISKKYNYKPILFNNNLGILRGFKELAKEMPDGPLLILENDLPLIENKEETFIQLEKSVGYLYKYNAAQVRLRSKKNPGSPFVAIEKYKKYWDNNLYASLRRLIRPLKARRLIGTSVYVSDYPEIIHKDYISKLSNGFFSVSSKVLNWSNLAIIVDKNFFLNVIINQAEKIKNKNKINGFNNIEIELNSSWWRNKNWKIIIAPGVFTHKRFSDRGY